MCKQPLFIPATSCFKVVKFNITQYSFSAFFFHLCFLSQTFTIHKTAWEVEDISLIPFYHFYPLHRHLDISWVVTAESSPLHTARSRTWTGNLWFPSASYQPLSYSLFFAIISSTINGPFCWQISFAISHIPKCRNQKFRELLKP